MQNAIRMKNKLKCNERSSMCYNFANSCAGLILQGDERSLRQPQKPSSSIGNGIGRGWSGIIPTYQELMYNSKSDIAYYPKSYNIKLRWKFLLLVNQQLIPTRNSQGMTLLFVQVLYHFNFIFFCFFIYIFCLLAGFRKLRAQFKHKKIQDMVKKCEKSTSSVVTILY